MTPIFLIFVLSYETAGCLNVSLRIKLIFDNHAALHLGTFCDWASKSSLVSVFKFTQSTLSLSFVETTRIILKRPWSEEERRAVNKHLRRVPGKLDCMKCLEEEKSLKERSWKDICLQYNCYSKKEVCFTKNYVLKAQHLAIQLFCVPLS